MNEWMHGYLQIYIYIYIKLSFIAEQKKTTEPSGHGDDFAPGEWMPSSSKRGTSWSIHLINK
jgi:hypothetical protein